MEQHNPITMSIYAASRSLILQTLIYKAPPHPPIVFLKFGKDSPFIFNSSFSFEPDSLQ